MTHYTGVDLNTDDGNTKTAFDYGQVSTVADDAASHWFSRVRIQDGADVSQGAKADAAVTNPASSASVIALLKGLLTLYGASASSPGKAEDSVAGTGDVGTFILAVRRDTPAGNAAAGDYHEIQVDGVGSVWVAGAQIEDAVAASGDRGHFMLAIRRDSPTSDAAAGDYHGLHVDNLGHLRTIDEADEDPSTTRTSALAASLVVKASAGKLFGFQGYSTTAGFVQVHNTTSVPSDAAVPAEVWPIEANKPFSFDAGRRGLPLGTGITLVFSSTGPTKTIGSSVMWVSAQYK